MEAKKTEVITKKEVVTLVDVSTPTVTLTLTPDEAYMLKTLVGGISGNNLDNYEFGFSLRGRTTLFPDNNLREKLTSPLYNALSAVVGF
jgi:hypothetical protein